MPQSLANNLNNMDIHIFHDEFSSNYATAISALNAQHKFDFMLNAVEFTRMETAKYQPQLGSYIFGLDGFDCPLNFRYRNLLGIDIEEIQLAKLVTKAPSSNEVVIDIVKKFTPTANSIQNDVIDLSKHMTDSSGYVLIFTKTVPGPYSNRDIEVSFRGLMFSQPQYVQFRQLIQSQMQEDTAKTLQQQPLETKTNEN